MDTKVPFNKVKCEHCCKNTLLGQARKLSVLQLDWLLQTSTRGDINRDGSLCSRCRAEYYCHLRKGTLPTSASVSEETDQDADDTTPQCVILPFPRLPKSRGYCVLCKRKGPRMAAVPAEARLDIFIRHGVLVPSGVVCCKNHLIGNHMKIEIEVDVCNLTNQTTSLQTEEISELLGGLRKATASSANRRIDFDSDSMSDKDMMTLTGITRPQFEDLVSHASTIRPSALRTARGAVGMLLMKLRLGLSLRVIATLCSLDRRCQVARIIQTAKRALMYGFVPQNLGFNHVSREDIITSHSTDYAIQLFGSWLTDSAILILDGTYVYIQKSSKYSFQRRCFSMHKHRPLVKPMMVSATDGYILSVVGPYFADGKNNDASIVMHMMKTNADNIVDWLRENDVFIVDRGFRDSLTFLRDCGIQTESPAFLDKSTKQLPTKDANTSRLVTKIRWAGESVNGRVKTWRYFDKVVSNTDIPNLREFLHIVAAVCNRYRKPLKTNSPTDCDVAIQMLQLAKTDNAVQNRVETQPALKHGTSIWFPIHANDTLPNWPTLTEEDVRSLTFGIYQFKQAHCYVDEYIQEGKPAVFLCEADSDLVHARIQSRHTSSKRHDLWIEYSKTTVTGWYCKCPAGARTVGCCSHIAAVVWYLSVARNTPYSPLPDKFTPVVADAAALPTSSDEEQSEDSD